MPGDGTSVERTILIMAGGTGGHVMPALAVAESLRSAGWRVVWMGSRGGMESRLVPRYGYDMTWVDFGGLRGKGLVTQLMMPLRLARAFLQATGVVRRVRPSVVLGMGGYISVPGGLVAAALRRPLVIHEQNSTPGLANRVLSRFADRILTAFPRSLPRSRVTGNPVRGNIASIGDPRERYAGRSGPLHLLVVGGSLGAQALNETVPRALQSLNDTERPGVVHQSGERHFDDLRRRYAAAGVQGKLVAFIEDMGAAYRDADLVLCRAGATTVAELAAAGVASVLVPYPHAVDDHQTANARFLAEAGAAVLVPQQELTPERLAQLLRTLTRPRLLEMARRARALGRPDAADLVARACVEVAGRRAVAGV